MRAGLDHALADLEAMLPEWTAHLRTPAFAWTQFDALAAPILDAAQTGTERNEVRACLDALLERHGLRRP